MNNLPTIDEQNAQAARWASLLCQSGYIAELHGSGFDTTWRIFRSWTGPQVAEISIDGCGASWSGTDELWLSIIGPSEGVTA